jgi:hypothetical protein
MRQAEISPAGRCFHATDCRDVAAHVSALHEHRGLVLGFAFFPSAPTTTAVLRIAYFCFTVRTLQGFAPPSIVRIS